jgi:SAM-dependent methyltransferase
MTDGSNKDLVYRREDCRLCGSKKVKLVLALTPTPPANAFVPKDALSESQPTFPLDVFQCQSCGHTQLCDVVNPDHLFRNYVYVSGTSPAFVKHFEDYAKSISRRLGRAKGLVIDIGSNDGTLLGAFKSMGYDVLGIDPAREIASRASANGIETIPSFFDQSVAENILDKYGQASIITANNVFAHSDHLDEILEGVRLLLQDDGLFVIEVSYLVDVVEKILFDTIYHEHLAYHALTPLITFFQNHGLSIIGAERVNSHGGSIRIIATPNAGPRANEKETKVDELVRTEAEVGLLQPEVFEQMGTRILKLRDQVVEKLKSFRADGLSVAGFGAPAKATTLMYHFGLGPDEIEFIIDDSPLKQNLYSPGLHVPVIDNSILESDQRPDVLVVLAWNFADVIVEKNWAFAQRGGKFLIPLPEVKVVQA